MDYKTEEKILDELEKLQEINEIIDAFDTFSKAADMMIYQSNEKTKDFPKDLADVLETLKEKGFTDKEIHLISASILKNGQAYLAKPKKTLKEIKNQEVTIKDNIGELLKDDLNKHHLTEKSIHFKGYGTVICSMKEKPTINNEQKFIEFLSKDEDLRTKYLKISAKVMKEKDIFQYDGIDKIKELNVSIRRES